MKRIICTTYITLVTLATAAALPSALHAQFTAEAPDGSIIPLTQTANGGLTYDQAKFGAPKPREGEEQLQKLLTQETGDGKHPPVVILDSVRADEKTLIEFAKSLREGKAHIQKGGVYIFAGDNKEVAKYGASADDKVIVISTERK